MKRKGDFSSKRGKSCKKKWALSSWRLLEQKNHAYLSDFVLVEKLFVKSTRIAQVLQYPYKRMVDSI